MPTKRTSAFSRALQEAQQPTGEEALTQHSETASPPHSVKTQLPHSETVEPLDSEEMEEAKDQVVKTSFYPLPAQLDKLDDLAAEYNKRYRRQRARINRNDIVRFLIDLVDLEMLESLNPKP